MHLCLVRNLSHFGLMPGKGSREELDDEEGKEISRRMQKVIERELLKEKAKL